MTEKKENAIIPRQNFVPATVEEAPFCDYNYCERKEYAKKVVNAVSNIAETVKMETAIAKKEIDTYAHASKVCIDSKNAYIERLIQDTKRKDITPEELADRFNRIEEAQKSLLEQANESKKQVQESSYQKPTNWLLFFLVIAAVGGAGVVVGSKFMPKAA